MVGNRFCKRVRTLNAVGRAWSGTRFANECAPSTLWAEAGISPSPVFLQVDSFWKPDGSHERLARILCTNRRRPREPQVQGALSFAKAVPDHSLPKALKVRSRLQNLFPTIYSAGTTTLFVCPVLSFPVLVSVWWWWSRRRRWSGTGFVNECAP